MADERIGSVARKTRETDIEVTVKLDGAGIAHVSTGVPFFDHMLDGFTRHALIDLDVRCAGDIEVDAHHSVEDTGIALGSAVAKALGDKRGIERFSSCALPMDEALILCAMDISGRGQAYWDMDIPVDAISTFDTQLAREFFIAFAANAGITLHMRQLAGENAHHLIEAAFKACGRALRYAVAVNPRNAGAIPSTKGAL
ncbi:MAG: imidazoleglycerol-phosphate dehydratase HisB [Eggerthellaceae bacterium]|nr:imidazoleglycerol-phosphate dehydratase HisB [Eggerthellaceae bacterium]